MIRRRLGGGSAEMSAMIARCAVKRQGANNNQKKYKKIKKYMRSPLFAVKMIDGTETIVTELLKEVEETS